MIARRRCALALVPQIPSRDMSAQGVGRFNGWDRFSSQQLLEACRSPAHETAVKLTGLGSAEAVSFSVARNEVRSCGLSERCRSCPFGIAFGIPQRPQLSPGLGPFLLSHSRTIRRSTRKKPWERILWEQLAGSSY